MKITTLYILLFAGCFSISILAQNNLLVPTGMTEPFLGDYSRVQHQRWYGIYCRQNRCKVKPAKINVKLTQVS